MNRHLFKKIFLFSFAILALLSLTFLFASNKVSAQLSLSQDQLNYQNSNNCTYKLASNGSFVCVSNYSDQTGAGTTGAKNDDGTDTPPDTETNTGTFYNPNTYCGDNPGACNGGTRNTDTTQKDTIEGKVIIQQDKDEEDDSDSSCQHSFLGYCWGGSSSNNGLKGATITIDSNITATTDSQGEFEKSVPHIDTHNVTLTVPEGYQLVSPTSATQTFGTTGSNWKRDLRDVKFTVQESEESATPTCDANGDGKTDTKDLPIIKDEWFGTATTKTGDCNKDGVVNGLDFQMWKDISVVKLNSTTLY